MKDKITIDVKGLKTYEINAGTKLYDFAKSLNVSNSIAVVVDGELQELNYIVKKNCNIEFLTLDSRNGLKIYIAGLKFVLLTAIKELYGETSIVKIEHSFDKGILCNIDIGVQIKKEDIENIKNKMQEIVKENITIEKINASTSSIIKYFEETKQLEKSNYYKTYVAENVTIYKLKKYFNYFYSRMPINTGDLKYFDLKYLRNNSFLLSYPTSNDGKIPEYSPKDKLLDEFIKYDEWLETLKIPYVSALNELVSNSKIEDFIELNEIHQNSRINEIVEEIYNKKIKVVLIGGPSSSGKTTSAKKVALYLQNKGLHPFLISVDDYYKERADTEKDENGNYKYEEIKALDIELFNTQMKDLLDGKEVIMPTFNFKTGKKEYGDKSKKLNPDDIIIIEGLHTMNEELTSKISRDVKYKIYASPFTPLGIDRHNHISTSDIRLLRRIVRDNVTRGYTPEHTIKNWNGVRTGEEQYVFPYQEEADAILNTILVYEIGVLKVYVEPLLHSIKKESEYYIDAKRLITFLNSFFPIPGSYVPKESILREFIGNSYFK